MKQIQAKDIEKLRQELFRRHDLLLENYSDLTQALRQDHGKMLSRLKAAEMKMDRLLALPETPTAQDPRVRSLHQTLNELRHYFGAPTGRPLEDRGVSFVEPYIRILRLMFGINSSVILYVEMIRTDLALLEYRLEHGQDISDCLRSLKDSIGLHRYQEQFTDLQDSHIFDLEHYLLLIHQLLMPLLFSRENARLRQSISRVYLEMAMAFSLFECAPEETDELFCDAFTVSMLAQLQLETPDPYIAQCCLVTAQWLWEYPLQPEQKEQVAYCYKKAKEVLIDA